jgi:hypothetical protein
MSGNARQAGEASALFRVTRGGLTPAVDYQGTVDHLAFVEEGDHD